MRGQGARLAYQGHVVTENRNGLVVAAKLTQASGYAEREAALEMVLGLGGARRITLAGDKGYDAKSFVQALRAWSVTTHVGALHGGRDADRGVGEPEELRAQGREAQGR